MKGYGAIIEDRYYRWVVDASRAGLQVMAHVGDEKGLRTLLAVYERVRKEQNLQDPRFRIEHAHDMPPDLIPLIAKVGAVVSWQPPLARRTLIKGQRPDSLLHNIYSTVAVSWKTVSGLRPAPTQRRGGSTFLHCRHCRWHWSGRGRTAAVLLSMKG